MVRGKVVAKSYNPAIEKGGLYQHLMYADFFDGVYAFGGAFTNIIESADYEEVVDEIEEWLNNLEPSIV